MIWFQKKEIMKEIPGYNGYYAEEDGFIYSSKSGSLIKLSHRVARKHPYLVVHLYINGRTKEVKVHSLVLYAFSGPRPDGYEARHLDGDCLNNKPSNLKWGTRQENVDDKKLHGTITKGVLNGRCKLSKENVSEIISFKGVHSTSVLAKMYGVAQTTISAIHTGRSWK